MKCGEFMGLVHDVAQRKPLDPAIAAIARAHADACPSCACRLAEAAHLARLLRAAAGCPPLETPPRVEANLLRAFRRQVAAGAEAPATYRSLWRRPLAWLLPAAAVAAFAFLFLTRSPRRPVAPAAASRAAPASSRPAPADSAATTGLSSDFVPVPYAGGFAPGELAVIVRVQVPRSSLAELGYPVDETQGEGVVQADLVVGEDGWPRAVRIVR